MTRNLKLASSHPTRTPERIALAQAISDLREVAENLDAARRAERKADERKYDARTRLDAIRASRDEAGLCDALIASVRAGAAVDASAFITTGSAEAASEGMLEQEIELWRKAGASCRARMDELEDDLKSARWRVEAAAKAVMRSEVDILEATAALENAKHRVIELYRTISFLRKEATHDGGAVLVVSDSIDFGKAATESDVQWRAAFEALKSNADAVLPAKV